MNKLARLSPRNLLSPRGIRRIPGTKSSQSFADCRGYGKFTPFTLTGTSRAQVISYTVKKSLFLTIIILFICSPVFAHKVNIFAYKEENEIKTESYFSDGTLAKNSKVEVYNKEGKKILDGKTDEKGEFSFSIPDEEGELRMVLLASMGHRAETVISVEGASGEEQEEITAEEEKLKRIVNRAVENAVFPVIKMLEEERKRIRFVDIVSGLGYILGISGIAFFLYKRKK